VFAHLFLEHTSVNPVVPLHAGSSGDIERLCLASEVTNLVIELIGGLPIFPEEGATHKFSELIVHPSGQMLCVGGNFSFAFVEDIFTARYVSVKIKIPNAMDTTMKLNDAIYNIYYSTKKRYCLNIH
jgi:hypothetical protein